MEYDLVMQRAPEQGMWMADHGGVSCALHAGIEQPFQPAGAPSEKQ